MGDVIQFERRQKFEKRKEKETQKPKIYPNLMALYRDLVSEWNLDSFPYSLSHRERLIFAMGIEAGRDEEQGLWTIPKT